MSGETSSGVTHTDVDVPSQTAGCSGWQEVSSHTFNVHVVPMTTGVAEMWTANILFWQLWIKNKAPQERRDFTLRGPLLTSIHLCPPKDIVKVFLHYKTVLNLRWGLSALPQSKDCPWMSTVNTQAAKVSRFKTIWSAFKGESCESASSQTAYFPLNVIKGRHKGGEKLSSRAKKYRKKKSGRDRCAAGGITQGSGDWPVIKLEQSKVYFNSCCW